MTNEEFVHDAYTRIDNSFGGELPVGFLIDALRRLSNAERTIRDTRRDVDKWRGRYRFLEQRTGEAERKFSDLATRVVRFKSLVTHPIYIVMPIKGGAID